LLVVDCAELVLPVIKEPALPKKPPPAHHNFVSDTDYTRIAEKEVY
jgi:hypothetical protein